MHRSIIFTYNTSDTSVNFLDASTYRGKRHASTHILYTKPYTKAIQSNSLLHCSPHHPRHTFTTIIKPQAIRMLTISSHVTTYIKTLRKLKNMLMEKQQPKRIEKTLNPIKFQQRITKTINKRKTCKTMQQIANLRPAPPNYYKHPSPPNSMYMYINCGCGFQTMVLTIGVVSDEIMVLTMGVVSDETMVSCGCGFRCNHGILWEGGGDWFLV